MNKRHEITFLAFSRNPDGTLSLFDIIETSHKWAALWWRRLSRDPLVCAIEVCPPSERKGRRVEVRHPCDTAKLDRP